MEEILKYENRDRLYKFLIDSGLVKIEEHYDANSFGNFYVVLADCNFLLIYINDRSFLTIKIASKEEPDNSIDLYFVKNFIYNPDDINPEETNVTNADRIRDLNEFLEKDYFKIKKLFSPVNYQKTMRQIHELLKQQFQKKFP